MQLNNIVVGVSDAPTSRIAGQHAFELAALSGGHVHVVTAVEDPAFERIDVGAESFYVDELDQAHGTVAEWINSLAPAVPWKVHAIDDKPADALVQVARTVDADLIVVGNVRMQGLGRLLGSVGSDVAHHAPCSVLIVKTV
jgi:nucleotide-binding universal stress UspA family protein